MRRFVAVAGIVGGLAAIGCNELADPPIVPVVLPGTRVVQRVPEGEQAEALVEEVSRRTIRPPGQSADVTLPLLTETDPGETRSTASKLQWSTLKPGSGDPIQPGQKATVHYVGTLTNGSKFDSSRDRDAPYSFTIGRDSVIRGWHEGVSGMKVGELRKLIIPPELGYGSQGQPPSIPPNATLVFEVELLKAGPAS